MLTPHLLSFMSKEIEKKILPPSFLLSFMSKEIERLILANWNTSFLLSFMSKEIEKKIKRCLAYWKASFLLSFMSKEIEKKILKILKNYLTNNKKYVIIYMIQSITRSMLFRRRGTVSLPSANSTACEIINLQDETALLFYLIGSI